MVEHDRTWARLVEMARRTYPDDPNIAAIHALEAFAEDQTAAYGRHVEQTEVAR
jgi:hypothetical protein